jgi:hypothetical protein
MKTEDRDRILQLVAYVKNMSYQTKQAMMDGSNYDRLWDNLQAAVKLCNPIVNSLNQPRRESYCPDCGEFHPIEESGPDFVCAKCRLVLMTFREVAL